MPTNRTNRRKRPRRLYLLFSSFVFGFLSIRFLLNNIHWHQLFVTSSSGVESLSFGPPITTSWRVAPLPRLYSVNGKRPELSACLIVMDDNHFLIEWLAYHYHTANLRHLIITSDPHSRTSPSKVLDRWKDKMSIHIWNETRFLPTYFEEQVKNWSYNDEKHIKPLMNHRLRQAYFNLECLKKFKRLNKGWTLLIDSDEYLLIQEQQHSSTSNNAKKNNTNDTKNNQIKNIITPSNVVDVLESLRISPEFNETYSPCLPIHRRQFSAKESLEKEVQSMVVPGFDGKNFQTLRWRHYGFREEWLKTIWRTCKIARNIPNKVMIDLKRVTLEELSGRNHTGNPHRPIDICPDNIYLHDSQMPFVLNHYMGTPEQWFYRSNDKRGFGYRKARYNDTNERIGVKTNDAIRPWLASFVESVGYADASRLLKGAGQLEPLPNNNESGNRLEQRNEIGVKEQIPKYNVGDIVEVNYGGDGDWYPAQIYAVHPNNYYSVCFDDCTHEIATFDARMRPMNKTITMLK